MADVVSLELLLPSLGLVFKVTRNYSPQLPNGNTAPCEGKLRLKLAVAVLAVNALQATNANPVGAAAPGLGYLRRPHHAHIVLSGGFADRHYLRRSTTFTKRQLYQHERSTKY